ncbi:MAG TPA: hypothetical protein VMU22_00540 [Rhizomicrobium sp.]|nr:hypothetical protein [Rhizomicrobium sp.]
MPRFLRVLSALAVAALLGGCVYPDDYYDYYGDTPPVDDYAPGPAAPPPPAAYAPGAYGPPGTYGAYDDPCFTDPGFCSYAWYDGPIWWGGSWYSGPHRWRVYGDSREFFIRGHWHRGVRIGDGGHWGGPGRWHG